MRRLVICSLLIFPSLLIGIGILSFEQAGWISPNNWVANLVFAICAIAFLVGFAWSQMKDSEDGAPYY